MIPIQSKRVRIWKRPAVEDSFSSSKPPQHEDIQFTIEVKNNAAAVRQDLNKTKYRQIQDVDRIENQCRKRQDMGCRCNEGTKEYPLRNRNGVRSSSQRDLFAPISIYKKNQPETEISRQEEKFNLSRPELKAWTNSINDD